MYYTDEIALKETVAQKVKRRDEQAEIILQIVTLAKKLNSVTHELSQKLRYPDSINQKDLDELRQELDKRFWWEMLDEYQAEKFMTSVDKNKFFDDLDKKAPIFDMANVMQMVGGFLSSRESIATNMIAKIYENITDEIFRKGNRGEGVKKLQKELPKSFRLSIFYTYGRGLPYYVSASNSRFSSITDLERACYLCDGKLQPDRQKGIESATTLALRNGETFVSCPYFDLQLFKNGNVKITFTNLEVLRTLNKWGRKGDRLE